MDEKLVVQLTDEELEKANGGAYFNDPNMYLANVTDYLVLRSGATQAAPEIGRVGHNMVVNVIERTNNAYWLVYVPAIQMQGYVSPLYLAK